MSKIMDADSNHVSGMSMAQPSGRGGLSHVSVGGGVPGAQAVSLPSAHDEMPDPVPLTSDEELDLEWVNKAKDIVEQTKADPFTLSNELNKVKADYLKVRFSKELNIGEKPSQ